MKKALLLPLTLLPAATTYAAAATYAADNRPNIILFLVDDMGWQDTSLPFWTEKTKSNGLYETPNMERLARQGMMFTQAYANSVSSPTRCSLMTGANATRHGVTNWTLERDRKTDRKDQPLQAPDWNCNGICQAPGVSNTFQATSFVQILKDNGYHTIHCGKAHFGAIGTPGENPAHFGFEVNIAGHAGGGLVSYYSEENYGHDQEGNPTAPQAIPGLERYWGTGTFVTEALTREALKALDKAKAYGQPFYLYMSHYAVHVPVEKDPRFYHKYIAKGMSEKEAAYATLIEGMDKSLGDLMDWLERNDEARNTVLVFMSDNGGLACQPVWRDGEPHTQNHPLYSGKGSAYEGGIREPMIVSWPGAVAPGSRCDKYLMIEDFFPTILEMARVKGYKTVQPVDGVSFLPLLKQTGDPSEGRRLYWNMPNLWGGAGPGIGATCTIRSGAWKLIYYYETGRKELFNIPQDIGEKNNLAAQRPQLVRKLSKELSDYLRKNGGQRPTVRETAKPCLWPDEAE